MWEADYGEIIYGDRSPETVAIDHGGLAWRPTHSVIEASVGLDTSLCLGIPFASRVDCERACEILNKEIPILHFEDEDDFDRQLDEWKSRESRRRYLVERCCMW